MEAKIQSHRLYPAQEIPAEKRKQLALRIIRNEKPVSQLANEQQVSRKFLYNQKSKAISGIDRAFENQERDNKVLFYIPVTKAWMRVFVLAMILHCRSSFRGVIKVFKDVIGKSISEGNIYNIIQEATSKAIVINADQDLLNVKHGTLDEVFHGNKPVLTGVDAKSLYCYLLSAEDHRDADTWAIHLWDLVDQGFNPDYTVADFSGGIREGQKIACPGIPCHGDVFHISQRLQDLKRYFANRLKSRISYLNKIESKMEKAKKKGNAREFSKILSLARKDELKFRRLSNDMNTLVSWMEHDVLATAGPDPESRRELYDFIVDEIRKLESIHPHRIKSVRITLENHRDNVLAFVDVLNQELENISRKYDTPSYLLWDLCELQRYSQEGSTYHEKANRLKKILKHKFFHLQGAVVEAIRSTTKASSAVENLHSRLCNYFFLRKEIGNNYLELLRFYLNHTPFLRSAKQERVGKTPAELLARKSHPHWLEMLGYEPFQAVA